MPVHFHTVNVKDLLYTQILVLYASSSNMSVTSNRVRALNNSKRLQRREGSKEEMQFIQVVEGVELLLDFEAFLALANKTICLRCVQN